uniref:Uncharacterized protein n=1 Tax=Panagrolaimus sp. PS1159 TaxID=55785 RepID=A0AC35FU35_9BILA
VAMIMQYGNNHFGGVGMMGEDPLTPGVRPPASASWLSNETHTPITNSAPIGAVPPLAAPPLRPIAPVMHNMLSNSNSNDFLSRSDPFTNSSPPLNDFKRMTADIGIQASNDVGVGVNLGCTCKCNCGANRQQNLRDANGFIPFYNGPSNFSIFGPGAASPPPHELTPPGMNLEDKFFTRSIPKEPTFSAAPGGPVSRTPSSQTPVEEPERVYDPFAYQMPLQQQLRSLKL